MINLFSITRINLRRKKKPFLIGINIGVKIYKTSYH